MLPLIRRSQRLSKAAALLVFVVFLGGVLWAAQDGVSLGELARRERQRKAAAKAGRVIDLLDSKKDCGGDWDCFLTALGEGKPARMHFPDVIEQSGFVISSEVVLETDKVMEASAVLSGSTQNTTARITDPERARLLLNGETRAAIDAREQEAQAVAKRQDSSFVACTFQKKALKEFLQKRKDGDFSDKDWEFADHCDRLQRTVAGPLAPATSP